jgi:two-component system, OmpR family, sensor kinase
MRPTGTRPGGIGWVEVLWGAFAVANLAAMWLLPGSETIPFHFIYVSLAVVYGFRVWPLKPTIILLAVTTVATGIVLMVRYFEHLLALDECSEIILMPLIFAGQVWHAERRLAAQREVERMANHERRLLQRQREFLRDVSHAVRTPLTIARGHLDLIRSDATKQTIIDDTDVILHQLDRLANMAGRLLTLEQLEGPEALAAAPTDFAEFVDLLGARWSVAVPNRAWEIDTWATGLLSIDVERFELALDALVENAVKFTDPGNIIRLACRTEDGWCTAEVSDSGSGLHPEDVPFVFDRFWKRSRPGLRPGHGLGLSVVRAIVEAHGGTVTAGYRAGGGASFTIRIPATSVNRPVVAMAVP